MPPSTLPPAAGDDATGPLRVALLVLKEERRLWLRALVTELAPGCRIDHASSPIDVALLLAREPADLLVLDLAFDEGATRQLVLHLARTTPSTAVLAFDDSTSPRPSRPCDVWSWHDAHTALRAAIDRLRRTPPLTPRSAP